MESGELGGILEAGWVRRGYIAYILCSGMLLIEEHLSIY